MNITINRKALKAISHFMANKDVRYYLNGMLVEVRGHHVRIIATNGHILAAYHSEQSEDHGHMDMIIPSDAVKEAAKWKVDEITITESGFSSEKNGVSFEPIDGKFPDWRLVVNPCKEYKPAAFNPDYVKLIGQAVKDLTGTKYPSVTLHTDGGSGLINTVDDPDFIAVIMPLRDKLAENVVPEWVKPAQVAKAA